MGEFYNIFFIKEMRQQLDIQKYLRLNGDPEANDVNDFLETHLDLVMLLVENNTCVTYREYIQVNLNLQKFFFFFLIFVIS